MGVGAGARQELAEDIRRRHQKDTQRQRIVLAVLVTLGVLVSAGLLVWMQLQPGAEEATAVVAPNNATEDYGFLLTPTLASGTEELSTVPVEVELYEDFLCPSCKVFLEQSGEFLDEQLAEGNISVVYRPIVFLVTQSTDEYSQRATNAAVCVADQAGVVAYSAMHESLMLNQPEQGGPGLTDQELIDLGAAAGADDISDCVENRTFEPWLTEALKEAKRRDVSGTPTVRIEGVNVVRSDDGNVSIPGPAELEFAIEASL